jgi:hypothetical protein
MDEAMNNLDEFHDLIEEVREKAEAVGLYLMGAHVQTTADEETGDKTPAELMGEGEEFVLHLHFQLGEVAFTPRVQDPDAFDEELAFKLAAPSETEMEAARILEQLRAGEFGKEEDGSPGASE